MMVANAMDFFDAKGGEAERIVFRGFEERRWKTDVI